MASILDNSYFYISIFSSMCFVASEILPFLPSKSNGILHAVLLFLANYNKVGNKSSNERESNKESKENNSNENDSKEIVEKEEITNELTQKIEQIEKEQENQKSINENILQELNNINSKIDKIIKPGASLNDVC